MSKENQWNSVSEQLPFYPDLHNGEVESDPLICILESSTVLGDDPDPEKRIPVYIVVDLITGEKKYVVQSYAVKKCVEAAKANTPGGSLDDIVFRIQFLGKSVVNGKPFNKFNTAYTTMKQWEAMNAPAEAKKQKK